MSIILNGTTGITTPGINNTGAFTFGGAIDLPGGTVGAPSLTTTGDLDTGIYFPAANQIAISTAGTQRVFVGATGDVGIGTGSPQNDSGYGGLTVNGSSGSIITLRAGGSNSGRIYTTGTDNINIDANGTASTNILFRTGTSSTERARIDAAGNFGLGVTPSAWSTGGNLQLSNFGSKVDGVSFANNAYFDSGWKYASNGFAGLYSQVVGQHVWYTAISGTTGNSVSFTAAMVLNASGNLLVGSVSTGASVAAPINISLGSSYANTAGTASKAKLRLFEANDGSIYGFGISDSLLETHIPSLASMAWYINNSEKMRLTSSGYFLTPSQPMISAAHTATEAPAAGSNLVQWTTTVNTVSGNWNAGTGTYTIPVAGKYYISCSLLRNTGGAAGGIYLTKNGSNVYRMFFCDSVGSTGYVPGAGSIIIDCAINDTIAFKNENTVSWYGDGGGLGAFIIQLVG